MASRAGLQEQQPRGVAAGKQKNLQPEGRNRRVLRDIGNLVPAPAVEGKPQIARPITRRYGAQLMVNGQKQAEKNNKVKPLGEAAVAQKKNKEKLKPEAVVVISSDDEEVNCKEQIPLHARRVGVVSAKKTAGKTYTSILTARSKAACALSRKPAEVIVDIDANDVNNELAAVEYVEDMYQFYKETEEDGRVCDYIDAQPDISAKMRAILVDWLIEVHRKFELMPESLYLTVNIVDRFLSMKAIPRKELQLVGMGSMLIACKYEEIWAPEVNDFIAVSDNAYARDQLLFMEKAILGKLEWYLTVPTPYVFLARYIKASVPSDPEIEHMAYFLAELGLVNYETTIHYCPSKLAASAVYAARCTLKKTPLWTETLKHYTGYSEDQIMDCAKLLVSFHSGAAENKLKASYRKYCNPDRGAVALYPAAKTLPPQEAASLSS
ncbi:G2/mitotic-specific cyclin S13-7-like isoform X2 [Coffea eugenioides]|uniref:G2/mitotic-specific cyclin S13-7-like isoform X2 n=1 Tax=Coffea eugenioides TaxID=49369 RepID=UPI000F60DEB8|nr:G2/mitotic-specific cyclin S13-7-like isoform X2 [Coffea eugenioides]